MQSFVSLALLGSIAAMAAAGVACGLRRWRLAVRLARAVVLTSPVVLILMVVAFIVLPMRTKAGDPSMTATMLSQGISEVMNCGVLAVAAALPAAGIWVLARSRVRVSRKSAG
jgi:hypothetical protein